MSIEKNYMAKIAMNKSVLKEYANGSSNRVVYLNNGDEFQICLFNPETFTVGAELSINGTKENGLIVIRPGERVWIERPIGKQRKFKFETYEVEDSDEVAKAIRNNGEVYVRFFKEKEKVHYTFTPITYVSNSWSDNGLIYNGNSNMPLGSSICTHITDPGLTKINGKIDSVSTSVTSDLALTLNNDNTCSCKSFASNHIKQIKRGISNNNTFGGAALGLNDSVVPEKATMETGRITTGSYSSQEFSRVDLDFETYAYKSETIKLLPMSRKPYTNSDLQKIYCTECGRKLNSKFKFCPYCGAKCI